MNNKIAGSVKYYNEKKGYGFIAGEDEKDYFVHGWEKGMRLEKELMSHKASGRISERLTDVRQEMLFVKQAAEITGVKLPGEIDG